jgi:hypothetical protein
MNSKLLLVKARKLLDPLWVKSWLKGRCWGPLYVSDAENGLQKNPFAQSNITIAVGDELVSISQGPEGLKIHEFSRITNTNLGDKVRKILTTHDIKISS